MSDHLTIHEFAALLGRHDSTVRKDLQRLSIPHRRVAYRSGVPAEIKVHRREVDLFPVRVAERKAARKKAARPSLSDTHPRMLQGVIGEDGKMKYPSEKEWARILHSDKMLRLSIKPKFRASVHCIADWMKARRAA